jgi:hypothetical protein
VSKYDFPDVDGQRINAGKSVRSPFTVPVHEDGLGTFHNVSAAHPMTVQGAEEAIAKGEVAGYTAIHKFGRNPAIGATEEDVWNVGGKETLLETGATMWIAAEDNVNGVGQTMRVEGLDADWNLQIVSVVLNGNTPVQIGAANNWTRVHRAYQISATPDPVQDVWIAEDSGDFVAGVPQTATNIHAKIEYTDAVQQTEKVMFTIPAGMIGVLYGFNASIGSATGTSRTVDLGIEIQELAVGATPASPSWTPWRRIDNHSLKSDGQSALGEEWKFPKVYPELTNIHMRATASALSIVLGDMTLVLQPA